MQSWERVLERWQQAGLLDGETAARVRAYEVADSHPSGQRWQVVLALLLGGILLGAGILLFVAAHWDQVGPGVRFATVMALLAALHAAGSLTAERFPTLGTVLHGIGTVACGAAIATIGQIFNVQEHWPAAVLLWAICAAAGWWLLRDQFQQICALILTPAWLVCEWDFRSQHYSAADIYLSRMLAIVGAVYLTAFVHSRRRVVAGVLFAFGAVLLPVSTIFLSEGWNHFSEDVGLPGGYRFWALLMIAGVIVAGALWNRRSSVVGAMVLLMSFALPWLQDRHHYTSAGHGYDQYAPNLLAYVLVAAVTVFLGWWGVQERSRAVVNYAVAMFAVVVMWFYFSSLMDKMGRSLGLMGLGLLFLLGGWMLERLRRKLVRGMSANDREEAIA